MATRKYWAKHGRRELSAYHSHEAARDAMLGYLNVVGVKSSLKPILTGYGEFGAFSDIRFHKFERRVDPGIAAMS
jgi:hypothetical protein